MENNNKPTKIAIIGTGINTTLKIQETLTQAQTNIQDIILVDGTINAVPKIHPDEIESLIKTINATQFCDTTEKIILDSLDSLEEYPDNEVKSTNTSKRPKKKSLSRMDRLSKYGGK